MIALSIIAAGLAIAVIIWLVDLGHARRFDALVKIACDLIEKGADERHELLTRIQGWAVARASEKPEPPKTGYETPDEDALPSLAELAELRVSPNSDGGWCDHETGEVWADLGGVRAWREECKRRGLPLSTPSHAVSVR